MSTQNWIGGGLLAPPSNSRPHVRNSQNGTQTTIMIEPTPEYQQFYNTTRREMDRQRLEYHVTEENNLEPPKAQSMSRSTTSDSLPSPSTVCSHAGDGNSPFSPDHAVEAARSKPPRGKRTGPLDMETRTKTAFKRKFKLTCNFHRTKKTSCNCFDFSQLEAGYLQSQVDEQQKTKASRGRSPRSLGDLGTFGAGGAAPATIPRYTNFDLSDLPAGHELPPQPLHANLHSVINFDIQSKASVDAIVTVPHEAPFYLPVHKPAEFAIGSSMPFRNRWECRYQHTTEETGSLASTGPCAWTGPYESLEEHFRTEHHDFEYAKPPLRSSCSRCNATIHDWVDERQRACKEPDKCLPDDWQKWLWGTRERHARTFPSGLALSEASGSVTSWFTPGWNMTTPGSTNTEQSNLPYGSYTGNSSFHDRLASGYKNNEAGDGGENNETYHVCEDLQNRCTRRLDATDTIRHDCRLPLSGWKSEHSLALYDPRLSLPFRLKSGRHLVLSLLTPVIVYHLLEIYFLIYLRGDLLAFSTSTVCLQWHIALTALGSLVAWAVIGSQDVSLYTWTPAV